jgi:hypothetical protein
VSVFDLVWVSFDMIASFDKAIYVIVRYGIINFDQEVVWFFFITNNCVVLGYQLIDHHHDDIVLFLVLYHYILDFSLSMIFQDIF